MRDIVVAVSFDESECGPMRREVIVFDPDKEHCRDLCVALEREQYRTASVDSLQILRSRLDRDLTLALFLDLDLISLDNRTLREIRAGYREIRIIGLSRRTFHPELKEALSRYIDACFSKPVDLDSLLYYLKGAQDNFTEGRSRGLDSEEEGLS